MYTVDQLFSEPFYKGSDNIVGNSGIFLWFFAYMRVIGRFQGQVSGRIVLVLIRAFCNILLLRENLHQ